MITISLTNFKSILETKTYSFEKGSVVHLVGPSGSGKTTVLCGFEWGLFGRLAGVKPRSRKDLVPRVQINTEEIKIDRNGNDLEVTTCKGIVLTSDAAQGHIYKIFGDRDLWKSCSYLEQRSRNILLEGSGEDKLKILRELVYGYGIGQENDPEFYLGKIQEQIKKVQTLKKSQQAVYDSFYDEFEKDIAAHDTTNNRWETCEYEISELKSAIEETSKEYKKIAKYHHDQIRSRTVVQDLKKRLKRLPDLQKIDESFFDEERSKIMAKIDNLKEIMRNQNLAIKVQKLFPFKLESKGPSLQNLKIQQSKRIENIDGFKKLGFTIKTSSDISDLRKRLELQAQAIDLESLSEVHTYIQELGEYKQGLLTDKSNIEKKIEQLLQELKDIPSKEELICLQGNLEKTIRNFKQRKPIRCPKCDVSVYFAGTGTLDLYEDIDIDSIKEQLEEAENHLKLRSRLDTLRKKLKEIENNIIEHDEQQIPPFNEKRYIYLRSLDLPPIDIKLKKYKDKLEYLIESYVEDIDSHEISLLENGESLSKLLGDKLESYLQEPDMFKPREDTREIETSIRGLQHDLQDLSDQHSKNIKAKSEREFLELELEKASKNIDKDFDEGDLEVIETYLEDLRLIEIDYIRYEEMNSKMTKLKEYESQLASTNKKLESLETLYEKIKKLSIEPVEKTIESINYKLNEYLDKLFTEVPIKIVLSLFRQSTGSKRDSFLKIAVNMQVYHGENSYPNISALSGGEADRVSLALTLTFAEIFRSPILMLDECMASLDSDLRESCLSLIKNLSGSSTTVIDVCHESVEGYHDCIVSVK